jgi:AcrR family transcriptional regulator
MASRSEPSLRERLREATREAILTAAEATFAERGIHAARMEDVASRAGVAVGTLYNYFADKKHVVAALIEDNRTELLGRLDSALAGRRPFVEQLTAWLDAVLAHFEAHRAFFLVFLHENSHDEHVERRRSSALQELTARAAKVVRTGLDQKALNPEHAGLYPLMLVALVRSVKESALRDGAKGAERTVVDATGLAHLFLHGAASRATRKELAKDSTCKRPRRA